MIRLAKVHDIDVLLEIAKACANHMIAKGIYQWNEHYPSKEAFVNDVKRNELYVLEVKNGIIGCIMISKHKDEEYIPIQWLTPDGKNLYVHRVAIHPSEQSKGYAQQLMDHAENLAIENSYVSIRLDTFSRNHRNQEFYELRGYKRVGTIFFPKQSQHPFYCYELVF